MESSTELYKKETTYKPFIWLAVIVVCLWGLSWLLIHLYYGPENFDGRGTFGDMFGAINSLFSGLAFAGIIYTIIMQRKELSLQIQAISMQTEELGLLKDETAKMASELERQRKTSDLQRLESLVFRLIETIQTNLNSVEFRTSSKTYIGLVAVENLIRFKKRGRTIVHSEASVNKYLRSVVYTIQFINDSQIDEDKKKLYVGILDVNLHDTEILFLYTFTDESNQHNLALFKKYGLLERYNAIVEQT